MAHAVVHFEIGGPDEQQLADFYAGLLGWDMRPVPDIGYTLIDTRGGAGINGGVARRADGSAAVTFYVQADDLQAVLDKVNLLGGKTETPITELPGMATYAKFEDLDGLVLGLVLGPADPAAAPRPGRPPGRPRQAHRHLLRRRRGRRCRGRRPGRRPGGLVRGAGRGLRRDQQVPGRDLRLAGRGGRVPVPDGRHRLGPRHPRRRRHGAARTHRAAGTLGHGVRARSRCRARRWPGRPSWAAAGSTARWTSPSTCRPARSAIRPATSSACTSHAPQ